jgi:small GTP-binding protein
MTTIQKKICLLGDFAVGKTSLVRRLVEGRFDDKYLSTIGVKISRCTIHRADGEMNLLIWDLAGGDEFSDPTSYLRGAAGALIVCDLTRRETLAAFERYASQVHALNPGVPLVLLGNKRDLEDERTVSDQDMVWVGDTLGAPYFLTSAKTGEQVEAAFYCMADVLEKR